MIMYYYSFLYTLIFDNLLNACLFFCSMKFHTYIKITMQLLCFTDCTVVLILAVSVLRPSSESVGTHCICANVYNAQHSKEAKFILFEPLSTSELRMCRKYQNLVHQLIYSCVYISHYYNYMPSHEQITGK